MSQLDNPFEELGLIGRQFQEEFLSDFIKKLTIALLECGYKVQHIY